jgi:hypothetical protein
MILALAIDRFMEYSGIDEVPEKVFLTKLISSLQELDVPYNDTSLLFLALAMLNADKTIRGYAAEIWIRQTALGNINNSQLGEILGSIEKQEWAPLKRATELIENNMIRISALHDKALERFVCSTICQIDTPITNLKKLLELYNELLSLNNSQTEKSLKNKLSEWTTSTTLKKISKQLIDR